MNLHFHFLLIDSTGRLSLTTASKVVDGRGKLKIRFNGSMDLDLCCVVCGVVSPGRVDIFAPIDKKAFHRKCLSTKIWGQKFVIVVFRMLK